MYTSLTNFKYGVDSRRSKLASMPGSLRVGTDGHINQGGSFEQRNAFTRVGAWPSNVYGLEITSNGLVVFGSISTPAGLPSGVSYVRCQHPSDTTQAMTQILCSCSFGGYAWCAAKFANNDVFIYYNGTIVPASMNGKVLTTKTSNQQVAQQLYDFLNTSYFSSVGIQAAAPVANGSAYYVDIYGAPGVTLSFPTPSVTNGGGGTGALSTQLISNASYGTAATSANFKFLCSMGTTGTLASIKASTDNGATFGVDLLSAAIPWVSGDISGYNTALNVAALVTGTISTLPATATASNNQVTMAIDPTLGSNPNGYPLKMVTTGDFCLDFLTLDFSAATGLSSSSITVGSLQAVTLNSTYGGTGSFTVSLAAGTYFYHRGSAGISISYTSGSLITLYSDTAFTLTGTTTVTVTGIASATVSDAITLMVEILGSATTGTTKALLVQALATKIRTYCAANNLKYTACASTYNTSHLVISRSEIRSDYNFYPVLSSDVDGVVGSTGQIVTSLPTMQMTYISTSGYNGYVNVSVVGGAAPYKWALSLSSVVNGLTTSTTALVVALPNGTQDTSTAANAANIGAYVSTGSIMLAVTAPLTVSGSTTATYQLIMTDSRGNAVTKNIQLVFSIAGSTPNLVVTFP